MVEDLRNFQFPDNISGFTFAEYLIAFIGLVFALAVAEFFISVGKILKEWKRTTFYWEFYLWIFVLLDLFILTWYVNWVRFESVTNGLFIFFLFTLPNLIIFLITAIFFPNMKGKKKIDLKNHFLSVRTKFFILFSLYSLSSITTDLILKMDTGIIAIFIASIYFVFGILNAFLSSVWLRSFLVFLFLVQLTFMMFIL